MDAEELANFFHDNYEALAPKFNYQTQAESAVPWQQVPENNRQLMIAVCSKVLDLLDSEVELLRTDAQAQLTRQVNPADQSYWQGKLDAFNEVNRLFEHKRHTEPHNKK